MRHDRQEIIEELRLRKLIRKGIRIVQEKRRKVKQASLMEEKKLRSVIRKLITETTATPDNDPAPHKSTGINVLEDLLKKVIPVLEIDYKKLTTSKEQRISFRAHVIKAVEGVLVPPKITDKAGSQGGDEPEGEMLPVTEAEGDDIDIEVGAPEDDDAFIDIDPESSKEEEEEVEEPDERDEFGINDHDETGRNVAFESFKKVQTSIIDSWDVLSGEEDKELFYDYLVTNLKLYFDKFENDMVGVEEPTTDEYESEKEAATSEEEMI
tara:strand:+ start:1511 stop:2311 length:801 start_codon:yes stop_codon:yes gene_type:complete